MAWSAVGWLSPDLFVVYALSCMSLLAQSPFFANTSYVNALWNAGSTPEGELAQVSFLVSNQLEDDAEPGTWQLMRHPVRVKESNRLKVVWVRNPKCSKSTST